MLNQLAVHGRSYLQTPRAFRPHLPDAVSYWARGERQRNAWAPHLAQARGLIDTTIDDIRQRRTVVVLGSGPLFDIPLESLARTFERVVLVDRVHLSTIAPRLARYGNVTCLHKDLSPLAGPDPLAFLDGIPDLDWVISPMLVTALAAAMPREGARGAVDAHLDRLAGLPVPATLLTDIDYRITNRHGVIREGANLLEGRSVPHSGLRWKWEAAPFGENHRHLRQVHWVAAWPDWRHA